ncbi:MAG: hypothetical protein QM726_10190 [Chitinophagaceae bacterium]
MNALKTGDNEYYAMKKQIPFDFLLDYLPPSVVIRQAIGMYYIYWDKKIVLTFRLISKNPQHNGLWIPTKKEHHDDLKAAIPAITDFVFDDKLITSQWLHLKDDHDDFETAAIRICELIASRDKRIGRETPKAAALTR